MRVLLKYTLFVEPDRQRLSHFVLYAVEELGGNVFSATIRMSDCMSELYKSSISMGDTVDVTLLVQNNSLIVEFNEQQFKICELDEPPLHVVLEKIATRLKQQSELASPELLRQRNVKIGEDLERAKLQATQELAQLESKLENRRLELERAQMQAERDSLTNLYNHGAYDSKLKESMARCKRQGEPLCLMMLDVDRFKNINDTHGHIFGDQYLKRMAGCMRDACRNEVDICCRLGGDEFAIILFAEVNITKRVANTILEGMNMEVSIGIAKMLPEDTPMSLMERCDGELYKAKEQGRGRIVLSRVTSVRTNKSK